MPQSRQSRFHSPQANPHKSSATQNSSFASTRKKSMLASDTNDELSDAIEQAKLLLRNQEVAIGGLAQPLEVLLKEDVAQPQWVVPEVLPVGVTVLAGRPGAGKSVLALGLALAVAEGGLFLNKFRVEQGSVLYLGLEDSRKTFYSRVSRFLQSTEGHFDTRQGEPHKQYMYYEPMVAKNCEWAGNWPRLDCGGLADLEDWLEHHPQARLLVIDSWSAVRPFSDKRRLLRGNDPVLLPLQYMVQTYHIAILLIQHIWEYDDSSEALMMNNAVHTMINGMMVLRRDGGMPTARLTMSGRDICEQESVITFEPQRGYVLIGGAERE